MANQAQSQEAQLDFFAKGLYIRKDSYLSL